MVSWRAAVNILSGRSSPRLPRQSSPPAPVVFFFLIHQRIRVIGAEASPLALSTGKQAFQIIGQTGLVAASRCSLVST